MNGTIILSGKSGSGKDMVATFMKEELAKHGKRTLIIHFADALNGFLENILIGMERKMKLVVHYYNR